MSYTQHLARPVLNIAPIEIPDTAIQVDVFAYDPTTGHETLDQLRRTYRGTHAVARRGAHIVCLPRIQSAPAVGGAQEALPLHENLGMVAALLRETLIDYFHSQHRPVISHSNDRVPRGELPDSRAGKHRIEIQPPGEQIAVAWTVGNRSGLTIANYLNKIDQFSG
jgi:hypothetical protein